MSQAKRLMRKRRGKAMPMLGAAGLLALSSGASAEAPADTSMPNTGLSRQVFLGEEEITDVSLATFYVFDKENANSLKPGVQLARGGCGARYHTKAPRCFNCARPMQLLRQTTRYGGLRDLYSFNCVACDEWHVEEGDAGGSATQSQGLRGLTKAHRPKRVT